MSRVLVVDDEENQVRVLAIGLRMEGFEVLTARSADVWELIEAKQGFEWNGSSAKRAQQEPSSDPFELLGIPANATGEAIREAYRQRCRENHPDRLQALGLPKEYIDVATRRMAAINAAYDQLRELRQTR